MIIHLISAWIDGVPLNGSFDQESIRDGEAGQQSLSVVVAWEFGG